VLASTALLGTLLAPSGTVYFIAIFGWYPVAKYFIERLDRLVFEWIIKMAVFTAVFCALYFALPQVLTGLSAGIGGVFILLYALTAAGFVVFDYGLSKLIQLYVLHILPKIRKR
jgi:hypothetical protein